MVKKRRTLAEHYRRLIRIIRFLSRRGTLFRKKPPDQTHAFQIPVRRKKKQWRQWRKIRYLVRRGTLIRKTRSIQPSVNYSVQPHPQKRSRGFSIYRTYRILRFLINTRSGKKPQQVPNAAKRKSKTFRKIRYLLKRGTLFKLQSPVSSSAAKKYFRNILGPAYLRICINSLLLFLLAYCIVFLLANLATSFAALSYDIRSVIYYFQIDYLITSKDWKIDAIKIVYATGPFFSLLLSLIVLILFINISQETWYFRLLFFWIFCHALIRFFGELLIGAMTTKGIGLTIAYLYASDYTKLFVIILSSSILISMGLLLTRLALFTGNVYFNMITRENRSFFLQSQFVIPSILGTGVVILMKSPKMTDFDMFISWTILIFILPVFFRGIRMKDLYFDPDKKDLSIRLWAFLAACIAIALFRAVFTSGLRIG